MFLKKTLEYVPGATADHWQIVRMELYLREHARVVLGLFSSQEHADSDLDPLTTRDFNFKGFTEEALSEQSPFALAYEKIVESKMEETITQKGVTGKEEVLDEEGREVEPAVEAVEEKKETVEMNWFVDAELIK